MIPSQWISIFVYHIHILLPKLILNTITFYQTVINSIFKWYKQYSITCITKIDIALNPFNLKLNIFNLTEYLFDRYRWVCWPAMLRAVRMPRPHKPVLLFTEYRETNGYFDAINGDSRSFDFPVLPGKEKTI